MPPISYLPSEPGGPGRDLGVYGSLGFRVWDLGYIGFRAPQIVGSPYYKDPKKVPLVSETPHVVLETSP